MLRLSVSCPSIGLAGDGPPAFYVMNYSTTQQLRQLKGYDIVNATIPHYLPNFKSPCWVAEMELNHFELHCLPYFFIAGFSKCGTTDIYRKLVKHPQIMRGLKELNYWNRRLFWGHENIFNYTKLIAENREAMLKYCSLNETCRYVIGKYGTPMLFIWCGLVCLFLFVCAGGNFHFT